MKKINKIFASILLLIGLYYFVKYIDDGDTVKVLTCLCIPILLIIPNFIKDKLNDKLIFIYYFYIFILMILGCLARFYSIFEYYDVFAHFMFGFLGSIISVYLLNYFKIKNKNIVFSIIFIISLTLALASLWEIFEYISSILFESDPQDVFKTGVRDTMEDILCSLLASIIFIIIYIFKKNNINKLVYKI